MNGWRGGSGAATGFGTAGEPTNGGAEVLPSGIGWAGAAAEASDAAARAGPAERTVARGNGFDPPDHGSDHGAVGSRSRNEASADQPGSCGQLVLGDSVPHRNRAQLVPVLLPLSLLLVRRRLGGGPRRRR